MAYVPTGSIESIFNFGLYIWKGLLPALAAPEDLGLGSVPWAPVQLAQGHQSRR